MDSSYFTFDRTSFCVLALIYSLSLTGCGGGSGKESSQVNSSTATVAPDTTPDAFSFVPQQDTETSLLVVSSEIKVSGITASANISISNGDYSINSATFTNNSGTVANGDVVKVRHTSSSAYATETSSVLNIGGVQGAFVTTTKNEPETPDENSKNKITTKISFPIESITSLGDEIPVTGYVYNADENTQVNVNGLSAEIIANSNTASGTLQWKASFNPNQYGNMPIKVTTNSQNSDSGTALTESNVKIPLEFRQMVRDPNSSEVFAIKDSALYKVNAETDSIRQLSSAHSAFDTGNIFYNDESKELFTVTIKDTSMTLYSISFTDSGEIESINYVKKIESALLEADKSYDVSWSQKTNTLALASGSYDEDSRVLLWNLNTYDVSVFAEGSDVIRAQHVLINDAYVLVIDGYSYQAYDISSKAIKHYSRINDYIHAAVFSSDDSRLLYIAASKSIYQLNIATGVITTLYNYDSDKLDALQAVNDIFFDQQKNQLVLHDSATRAVYALDLTSNTLSTYYSTGRGQGPAFVSARAMDMTADNNTVYVFDDGFNGTPSIIKVDVATGNREILTTLERALVYFADGLILNETKNELYAVTRDTIYSIDIESGNQRRLLSNNDDTDVTIGKIGALTFDKELQQLYFIDQQNSQIVKFDLETKATSIAATVKFNNLNITDVTDIALRKEHNSLLAMSLTESELFEISIESGETKKLINSCLDSSGIDRLDSNSHVEDIHYSKDTDSVYIVAFHIVEYDFATGACSISPNANVIDLITDSDGRLFGSEFTEIKQIEFDSGRDVTISRL